jgi:REP element-mobilizing transposase RayT
MKRPVLIVTPGPELGELISTSLRDTHQFEGFHFREADPAIAFLQAHRDCECAIIETQLGEVGTIELGHALRRIKRGLQLVLIARTKPSRALDELQPWRLLRQPFLVPELFAALGVTAPQVIDLETVQEPSTWRATWLEDSEVASRTLERLTRTTDIQEAMILREFDLWASSGHFSNSSIGEIKDMLLNSMGEGQQFDLLRFMRFKNRNAQHGVWAKLLLVNVILAVIYDLDTPISEMRTQANALAEALSRPLLAQPPSEQVVWPGKSSLVQYGRGGGRAQGLSGADDGSQLDLLDPLSSGAGQADTVRRGPKARPGERPIVARSDGSTSRAYGYAADDNSAADLTLDSAGVQRAARGESENQEYLVRRSELAAGDSLALDAYGIPYSCVLTPRFDTQPLSGHLAAQVQRKLPGICISYGWRLESVEVIHDCLQWLVRVPATEAIADHIEMVRKLTSEDVFDEFPELLRENLSKDFWAPGFSVKAGTEPHTQRQVLSYLRRTRHGAGPGTRAAPDNFPSDGGTDDWSW